MLEGENTKLVAGLAQAEMDHQKLVQEFVKTLYTRVKYRKSLAVPIGLCFTAGWLGGLSLVVDSYRLPMDDLLKISPDVPSPTANAETGPSGNVAFQ
ncbi:hypothetical protein Tco_1453739 [Tanacetum coccineum]